MAKLALRGTCSERRRFCPGHVLHVTFSARAPNKPSGGTLLSRTSVYTYVPYSSFQPWYWLFALKRLRRGAYFAMPEDNPSLPPSSPPPLALARSPRPQHRRQRERPREEQQAYGEGADRGRPTQGLLGAPRGCRLLVPIVPRRPCQGGHA